MTKRPTTAKTRAAKQPKPDKPTKPDKAAEKVAKQVEAAKAAVGSNSVDPKVRELFEHHLKKIQPIANRIKSLTGDLRSLYKTAKSDGFTSEQFVLAMAVRNVDGTENADGVEKLKEKMRRQAATLLYIGSSVGTQFDMFAAAPAPSEDESIRVAYDAGRNASKADNPAKTTDYAPDSPQMQAYLNGFHDNEGTKLKDMKTLKTEDKADPPASGQGMTRAQYRAEQERLAQQRGEGSTH